LDYAFVLIIYYSLHNAFKLYQLYIFTFLLLMIPFPVASIVFSSLP
jgi:hypothetical protein